MLLQDIKQTRRRRAVGQSVDDDGDVRLLILRHDLRRLHALLKLLLGRRNLLRRLVKTAEIRKLRLRVLRADHMITEDDESARDDQYARYGEKPHLFQAHAPPPSSKTGLQTSPRTQRRQ